MKISDYAAIQPYQFGQNGSESAATSQYSSTFTQDNAINFTTKEGDKVTLSQSFSSAFDVMMRNENNANGSSQSLTTATIQNESVSLQVEGDLNEEELADIQKLIKNLYSIAENFFNGDQGKVESGVNSLTKDMGTISNLSASFYQTQMITSYTSSTNNSPEQLTGFQDPQENLSSGLQNFTENDKKDLNFVNDLLKGQWQQISKMLDLYDTELHEENVQPPAPTDNTAQLLAESGITDQEKPEEKSNNARTHHHAKQMMERVADTIDQHPRLQPFSQPIVNSVIKNVAETNNSNDISPSVTTLKNDFSKQFSQWLMG